MLGTTVKNQAGEAIGQIKDLQIDLGKGKVSSVLVAPAESTKGAKEPNTIPFTQLRMKSTDGTIVLIDSSGTPSKSVPREDPNDKSELVLLSKMGEIPIQNRKGEKIGRVTDFGLSPTTGLIRYTVLALKPEGSSSEVLYPVPLAAYVALPGAAQWSLELPQDILKNTPVLKASPWPTAVPRAWSEYIHVRYGRSPSSGLQREVHDKKSK